MKRSSNGGGGPLGDGPLGGGPLGGGPVDGGPLGGGPLGGGQKADREKGMKAAFHQTGLFSPAPVHVHPPEYFAPALCKSVKFAPARSPVHQRFNHQCIALGAHFSSTRSCWICTQFLGPRVCTPQYIPTQALSLKAVYDRFLIMNPSMGMYQEIHPNPCWVIGIVSVEIYTSLVMLRE